ncbi:hypothetical protein [Brevibacillus porteri]
MDCKIVVADDEQTIVSAIAYALVREGFQVETETIQHNGVKMKI